ncbi:hypothetical protein MJ575_25745 [Klebsiella pneumoniae]|nr:hypothetical protein MJ575_25745 [Klebsiella pneumoniae]
MTAFSPAVGRKSAKIFSTRLPAILTCRLWQKKKARQLAFSNYILSKTFHKETKIRKAMFRTKPDRRGILFSSCSARIIISPHAPPSDDVLDAITAPASRGGTNLLQWSTEQ